MSCLLYTSSILTGVLSGYIPFDSESVLYLLRKCMEISLLTAFAVLPDVYKRQDELYHRSLEGENFTDLMDLILSRDNILLAYRNLSLIHIF